MRRSRRTIFDPKNASVSFRCKDFKRLSFRRIHKVTSIHICTKTDTNKLKRIVRRDSLLNTEFVYLIFGHSSGQQILTPRSLFPVPFVPPHLPRIEQISQNPWPFSSKCTVWMNRIPPNPTEQSNDQSQKNYCCRSFCCCRRRCRCYGCCYSRCLFSSSLSNLFLSLSPAPLNRQFNIPTYTHTHTRTHAVFSIYISASVKPFAIDKIKIILVKMFFCFFQSIMGTWVEDC